MADLLTGASPIDPTWINAASNVLGKALAPGNTGPSRADGQSDSGGFFDFGAPFVVTTGSGSANLSQPSALTWILVAALGLAALKLWKKP